MAAKKRKARRSQPPPTPPLATCEPVEAPDRLSNVDELGIAEDIDDDEQKWLVRLLRAAPHLTGDDLNLLVERLELEDRRAVARIAGLSVDPRFVPRQPGLGPLLAPRLGHLPPQDLVSVVAILVDNLLDDLGDALIGKQDLVTQIGERPLGVTICFAAAVDTALRELIEELPTVPGTEPAPDSDVQDAPAVERDDEESPHLFTPMDQLLIRTAVAAHGDIVGSPSVDELDTIIDEFVHLNADRKSSLFHVGFSRALSDEPPAPPDTAVLNEERARWHAFGLLAGYTRSNNGPRLVETVSDLRAAVEHVVADSRMAATVLSSLATALIETDPGTTASLLQTAADIPFSKPEVFELLYRQATALLVDGRHVEAEALFRSLVRHVAQDEAEHVDDLRRRIASCRRAVGDFSGATTVLDDCGTEHTDAAIGAAVEAERALAAARVERLRHIAFPRTEDEATNLAARLADAAPHLDRALALDPTELRVSWLGGVSAAVAGDHTLAARRLEAVAGAIDPEPAIAETGIVEAARFHGALSSLRTGEAGIDGPAVGAMRRAMDAGYEPPVSDLVDAVEWLGVHGSSHTALWADDVIRSRPECVDAVAEVVAQVVSSGPAELTELAVRLAQNESIDSVMRFDLLASLLPGGTDPETAGTAADLLDDLVNDTNSEELDGRWAALLVDSRRLRDLIGHDVADLARAECYRRVGAVDDAASIIIALLQRAIAGSLPHLDPAELVITLHELGHDPAEVAQLRRVVEGRTERDPSPSTTVTKPRTIIFVGGHEAQERYQPAIEAALSDTYGAGLVTVRWFHPGWGSNWNKVADEVERQFSDADALVLMTYVRTNLGRRLRRTVGDAGLPWVSCTGHGRQSLLLAIERAVAIGVDTAE